MKKIFYLFLFLSTTAWAQKITIKGRLLNDTNGPLPSATVMLMNAKDSSLVNFSISSTEGFFEIKNVARNNYLLQVSYVGYAKLSKRVEPQETETVIDLGDLKMELQSSQLGEVVVEAEKAPVVVKKDTIEFNASSFKTKENANVEDLLKKLPGVEVASDGSITAQGEQVQRVTVDGKEFFGRDPKIATQNLPAKAVDKVQVFDKKSDQTAFTGIDDGQREKTINLELKEEFKNGFFGNAMGAYGSDDRYSGRLSLNRFKKNQQLSLLLMGNNINEQGFSISDYMNFTGNSQQMMAGTGGGMQITFDGNSQGGGAQLNFGNRQSGLMTNYAGGVNFNQDFSKKTKLQSNYFYNQLEHNIAQDVERENFFGDSSTYFSQHSRQYNTNYNHRVNTTLEHQMDSSNSIKWTTTYTNTQSESNVNSQSETENEEGAYINRGERTSYSARDNNTINTNALWRHRFAKKGRNLTANVSLSYAQTNNEGAVRSTNIFYQPFEREQNIDQLNDQLTKNTVLGGTISYTEPLGNRRYLELNYNYSQNRNNVDRNVYDIENEETVLNETLSSEYTSVYTYHRPGMNLRMNREKYSVTAGASLQQTELNGDLISKGTKISRPYSNILPSAHFNYDFSSSKHLNIDYETSVQEPTITQLQPVYDNSDPLNITLGNINLRPAFRHSVRTNFMMFNPVSFVNFSFFANAVYTKNAITNEQSIDVQGVRTSRPVNVDNNVNLNANASLGVPINKIGSRINLSANANQRYGTNVMKRTSGEEVLSDVESNIRQSTLSSTLRYSYRYKEIFDTEWSASLSRNSTDYEFNAQSNQLYFNNTYRAEANLTFLKKFLFSTSFEYLTYNSKTTDFNQTVKLMNVSLSRYVLKNSAGEIKLSVNNLFNNNFGISQTANANYVERSNTNNLGRYYMVSFIYALNKQLNPMGQRRGGGMMRIMRGG